VILHSLCRQILTAMKIEAPCPSKTLVSTHKSTQCHNPEDHSLNENLEAYILILLLSAILFPGFVAP
jgi:hypothetical protein